MKLFVFNPEHDISLASHLDYFTPPRAARRIRHDLGFIPVLWASDGDMVLVDDVETAASAVGRLGVSNKARLVTHDMLRQCVTAGDVPAEVCPWGWDRALRKEMEGVGLPAALLPDIGQLDRIRQLSHRGWAAENLLVPLRRIEGTTGEAVQADSVKAVSQLFAKYGSLVLKAPWSSSGRGIRFVAGRHVNAPASSTGIDVHLEGWIRNVISRQGCVMAEPWYDKVCDFGMEFYSDESGRITYKGLSVFQTANGAYIGNVLGNGDLMYSILNHHVASDLLKHVALRIAHILSPYLHRVYHGPFGIDMMVVRSPQGLLLHPCVELNLRATMGHVALALSGREGMSHKIMRIKFASDYQLQIVPFNDFSATSRSY